MPTSYVNTENQSGIATITFYTPHHNALPSRILKKLREAIVAADASSETRIIILKSGGDRTFCAGADFNELLSIKNETEGAAFFMGFAKVILAMRSCKKLIIGRVQGKTIGGGVGLAAACDYCFAAKYASIKLSEISLGIGPFVISPAVGRKMGDATMAALTLEPQSFHSAEWAMQKGLYNQVLDTASNLDMEVQKKAEELVNLNPGALEACKQIFWEGTENWPTLLKKRAEISGKLVLSPFTLKALAKYK